MIPVKIADNGKPYGGLVRIVNDVDFETINVKSTFYTILSLIINPE